MCFKLLILQTYDKLFNLATQNKFILCCLFKISLYLCDVEILKIGIMKTELLELRKTQKNVLLNGWLEDIDYVLTLHLSSLTRVEKGIYLSNPN